MDENNNKIAENGEENITVKKKKTGKEIAALVINIIIWVFVAFAVFITVVIFASFGNDDGIPSFGKTMWVSIQSDSMKGVFSEGDMIFAEKLTEEEKKNLAVDDIVTFYSSEDINGDGVFNDMNTHKIVNVETDTNGNVLYTTKGVNNSTEDKDKLVPAKIIARYTGRIGGLGSVIDFMKTQLGFGLCIVLPVIALFVYYLISFIILIKPKKKVSAEEEAEIKRLAIEEYLRQQKAAEAENNTSADETVAAPEDNDNNKE